MKTEGNVYISTRVTEFNSVSYTNSNHRASNGNFPVNYGDLNRMGNLLNSNSYSPQLNPANENSQQNNAPAMDFFAKFFAILSKVFGMGSQNSNSAQPANNFQNGAGAINKVTGKAANMANDPAISEAIRGMQAEQAANPGKPIKKTVKGSDGKKYKLNLDENGNLEIKKKKKGFLSGLFKGLGKIFKTGLSLMSQFGSFIPGWGTLASAGSSMLLNVMNKK